MNVKLLREVEKRILAEPRRFDMMTFGEKLDKRSHRSAREASSSLWDGSVHRWSC